MVFSVDAQREQWSNAAAAGASGFPGGSDAYVQVRNMSLMQWRSCSSTLHIVEDTNGLHLRGSAALTLFSEASVHQEGVEPLVLDWTRRSMTLTMRRGVRCRLWRRI